MLGCAGLAVSSFAKLPGPMAVKTFWKMNSRFQHFIGVAAHGPMQVDVLLVVITLFNLQLGHRVGRHVPAASNAQPYS